MKAIVSLATERGNYYKAMRRLGESLIGRFDGDFLGFEGEDSVGSPRHDQNPYAFKIYAIIKAVEMGYTKIIWADSSCYAIKDVQPIFDVIEERGYFFQEAGHWVGSWCNNYALEYFGLNRDEAMKIPMLTAGFIGLDFTNGIAKDFFSNWKQSMLSGCFIGSWLDHRHDMPCASILAHRLGMKLQPGNMWLQYAAPNDAPNNESVIFKLQGL